MLLVLVAVASRGDTSFVEGDEARRPSHLLIDTLVSLWIVMMAFGAVAAVWLLLTRKESRYELIRRRSQRRKRSLLAIVLVAIALALGLRLVENQLGEGDAQPGRATVSSPSGNDGEGQRYDPEFALLPVLVVLGLGVAAAVALVLADRSRRKALPPFEPALVEALADVLDESIDDLRAERDPRRAVVAAYARLERALAAYGLPRRAAEAPAEYLERILVGLEISPSSIRRLTALFERAKFSQHDVDTGMKEEAIDALVTARTELRSAHERAVAEAALALAEAQERAAG
jgi:hypothetical protein